jgi:hypothetical protein
VLFIEVLKRRKKKTKKICPYGKLKTRISKKNGVNQEALIPYGSLLNIENVKRKRGNNAREC